MSQHYYYPKSIYFSNGRSVLAGQLHTEINDDDLINNTLVRVFDDSVNDHVEIVFDEPLDSAERHRLDLLVQLHRPDDHPDYFDAVVDMAGRGTHISVAKAFQDGATSVYVRDGTYLETETIDLPDGGQLVGESQGNVKLVLMTGNSVQIDGSKGKKETIGTLSIENKSQVVIGHNTQFSRLKAGHFVLLGTNYYEIAAVQSDSRLFLQVPYEGKTLRSRPYIAQSMYTGVKISNVIIANSAGTGLYLRAIRHCCMKGMALLYCTPNLHVQDAADVSLGEIICGFSRGVGVILDNAVSIISDTLDVYNSTSHGIELRSNSYTNVFDACSSSNNNGNGICVSGSVYGLHITDGVMRHNNGLGLFTAAGSTNVLINSCSVIDNQKTGIQFNGEESAICNNIVRDNDGDGLVAGKRCLISSNKITANLGNGIECTAQNGHSLFSDNTIEDNGKCGIHCNGDNLVINNNLVRNNGVNGIFVGGKNNTLSSNNVSMSGTDGILLGSTCQKTLISANQSFENKVGVHIMIGALRTLFCNNMVLSNKQTNFCDEATDTTVNGNVFQ